MRVNAERKKTQRKTRNHALMRRSRSDKTDAPRFIVDSGGKTISMVYFIRWRAKGFPVLIRIGSTARGEGLVARLKQHRDVLAKCGEALDYNADILAVVAGEKSQEEYVHGYFAKHRWEGQREIFHPATEILDYIRWLRDQSFVETGDDTAHPERQWPPMDIEAVTADRWLPEPGRAKDAPIHQIALPFGTGLGAEQLLFTPRGVGEDDYYTPDDIMSVVREFWPEGIDLDPASHATANRVVRAQKIYTIHENGLLQRWYGRVWLNPPFADWKQFSRKVLSSLSDVAELLTLSGLPTISADYYQELWGKAAAWCFLSGRPVFRGPYSTDAGAPSGFVVSYYGTRVEEFGRCFQRLGVVGVPMQLNLPFVEGEAERETENVH